MPNFSVDLDNVANIISKRSYKLSEIQDKIEKVAFDVCRFKDGNPEELWQIQSSDDGDYIVALYTDEDMVSTASVKSLWSVASKEDSLHIFYKNEHLCKVAASELGFTSEDLKLASQYLPRKLSSNKSLVNALLNTMDKMAVKSILSKYPELV